MKYFVNKYIAIVKWELINSMQNPFCETNRLFWNNFLSFHQNPTWHLSTASSKVSAEIERVSSMFSSAGLHFPTLKSLQASSGYTISSKKIEVKSKSLSLMLRAINQWRIDSYFQFYTMIKTRNLEIYFVYFPTPLHPSWLEAGCKLQLRI